MHAEDRHRAIVETTRARGSLTIIELAEVLGVSAVTIRGDVRELARRGIVRRVHGGVTWPAQDEPAPDPATPAGSQPQPPSVSGTSPGETHPVYNLGMVVPHASYYYPEVVNGARAAADALGAKLVLGVSHNTVSEEQALVARMLQAPSGLDGLVLSTVEDPRTSPGTEAWLRELPVPVVLAERRTGPATGFIEEVATDHEYGAHLAVRHLAEQGRTRIALLQFDTLTAPMLRVGHREALAALHLSPVSEEVPHTLTENDLADLDEKCAKLVRAVEKGLLDAVLVHNDAIALPLVSRLQAAGVRIPADLAVVTYDDELAALADPPLTGVAPPRHTVGAEAVDLLIARLRDPARPTRALRLRPVLHPRGDRP